MAEPGPDPALIERELLDLRVRQAALAAQVERLKASPPQATVAAAARLHLFEIQPVRDLMVIAALIGLLWLGKEISLVTVPMLLAMLLAYLFEPLVRALTRHGWFSRPGAALLIIFASILIFVVPITLGIGTAVVQGSQVAEKVARTSRNLLDVMGFTKGVWESGGTFGEMAIVRVSTGTEVVEFRPAPNNEEAKKAAAKATLAFDALRPQLRSAVTSIIKHHKEEQDREAAAASGGTVGAAPKSPWWMASVDMTVAWLQNNTEAVAAAVGKGALGTGTEAFAAAFRTLRQAGETVLMLLLTAFFFYFFSTGFGRVLAFWEGLIPERRKGRVIELVQKMDRVIAGFVRGRLTICAIIMAYYTVVYWVIGVPAPLVLGPLVGAFAIVPFMTIPAMPLAILLMTLEPGPAAWQQSPWCIFGAPVLAYLVERTLDDYILTPIIQGKHTEMAVPTILFASLAGGVLAGVYGLLIAIPVAACLRILLKEVFWPRFKQWAEGRQKDFLPISGSEPPLRH